jgi:hypothetical protein
VPTSIPYPSNYAGNGDWWPKWLAAHPSPGELQAFRGWQYGRGEDPDRLDSAQLDASYSAFQTKMATDGVTFPTLPPGMR